MKKTLIILLLFSASAYAQEENKKSILRVNISHNSINNYPRRSFIDSYSYRLEYGYYIHPYIEVGPYLGLARFESVQIDNQGSGSAIIKKTAAFYGLNVNTHWLPMLLESENTRLDAYLGLKLGAIYFPYKEGYSGSAGTFFQWGLYSGWEFRLSKTVGFFTELGIARGNSSRKTQYTKHYFDVRGGLSIRF